MLELPNDVLCLLFTYLNITDLLLHVNLVCKKWHSIISSGKVYCLEQWIYRKNIQRKKSSKWVYEGEHFSYFEYNWEIAIHCFTRAIIFNPRNELAYFLRAYAYYHIEKYELAIEDFTRSIQFEVPTDPITYVNRGVTYRFI